MTTIEAPSKQVSVVLHAPDLIQSCKLSSPGVIDPVNPGDPGNPLNPDTWVPLPPGVDPDDLSPPPTIVDTSPDRMIGCIVSTGTNAQNRLNALFPAAIEEDGVVERATNDIWVLRGGLWVNVGPNPGPTIVIGRPVRPFNEKVFVIGLTKTQLFLRSLQYALELLTSFSVATKTKLAIKGSNIITAPSSIFSLLQQGVSVIGGAAQTVITLIQRVGTAAPVLGVEQVSPTTLATDNGWTLLYDSTADENSIELTPFGFSFTLNNISYENCFINSNCYITFGGSLNEYSNLGATVPGLPKIHIGSRDLSYQRVYIKKRNGIYRIRWEGSSDYAAPAGSSNRFVEINFFKPLQNGTQYVEVRSGDISGVVSGPFMIATQNTALATSSFAANQSWVFSGNATGTAWTVTSGAYIDYNSSLNVVVPTSSGVGVAPVPPAIEVGLIIEPSFSEIEIRGQAPSVSISVAAAIPASEIEITGIAPVYIGYRNGAFAFAPMGDIAVAYPRPSVASGKSIAIHVAEVLAAGVAPIVEADEVDPYFSNVSLLLHANGTNGSRTIVDSSFAPKSITAFGSAQISTAQNRFSGSSLAFDGVNDYLAADLQSIGDFGTADFTVEAWIYLNSYLPGFFDSGGGIFDSNGSGLVSGVLLLMTTSGALGARLSGTLTISTGIVPLATWTHVALSRSGSTCKLFVGGIEASSFENGIDLNSDYVTIGKDFGWRENTSSQFPSLNGYIDELRVTKGVARYQNSFTPPTAQFPDQGIPSVIRAPATTIGVNLVTTSISSGASVIIPVSTVNVTAIGQVTIVAVSIASIETQVASIEVQGVTPVVLSGGSITASQGVVTLTGLAPVVAVGISVAAPTASVVLLVVAPVATVGVEGPGYWSNWALQNYGWDPDLYPDWWAY